MHTDLKARGSSDRSDWLGRTQYQQAHSAL